MSENIKEYLRMTKKILLIYLLAIVFTWIAYPVLIFLTFIAPIDKIISVYSVLGTLLLSFMLYISMHEAGEKDRKPFNYSRYKAKGFVCGAAASVIITLLGYFIIFLADRYIFVQHPVFSIANINSYVKMIIYIPFFWFFNLIKTGERFIPEINYLSALFAVPMITVISGAGYLTGFSGVNIIKKEDGSDIVSKILYKKEEK